MKVEIGNHKINVYRHGNSQGTTLVFMSGSGTVAPVYDFKVLYSKLQDYFNIVVIEKFGYGYSDIVEYSCDIDRLVDMQNQVLDKVGGKEPYILVPHSMSGLEAIRWKQKYPHKIKAIIGIDMATPLEYILHWDNKKINQSIKMIKLAKKCNLHKIPGLYSLNTRCLTAEEKKEQKMLMKRNAYNICYINEAKKILENAEIVKNAGNIECPILLFSSNGKQIHKHWVESQQKFASVAHAKLICYNCGHYIHYYKSNEMCKEIINFVNGMDIHSIMYV